MVLGSEKRSRSIFSLQLISHVYSVGNKPKWSGPGYRMEPGKWERDRVYRTLYPNTYGWYRDDPAEMKKWASELKVRIIHRGWRRKFGLHHSHSSDGRLTRAESLASRHAMVSVYPSPSPSLRPTLVCQEMQQKQSFSSHS